MNNSYRTIGLWVVLIVLFMAFYNVFSGPKEHVRNLTWQSVQEAAEDGRIQSLSVRLENGRGIGSGVMNNGERFATDSRGVADFADLEAQGVPVSYAERENSLWLTIFSQWLPIVFLFLFFMFFLRKLSGKSTDVLEWKASSEKITQPVRLQGLAEVRARLKNAADAARNGTPGPRRILLTGVPGTGKTTLLKAAAVDSALPLIAHAGSQFIEVFVGVGPARLRKLFKTAQESAPCIVAIDDFDAFATRRQLPENKGGVVDERAATMLELANNLDGLGGPPAKVLFVATTSRPDLLDEMMLRPGRFDLRITLQPGGEAQVEELKIPGT
jgi:cell division protease FtsH